ncbi:hypothetical protein FACS1894199_16540 [Bacteroidia bacterium]|nr:hypothetical protein FACS1894199_16540 [Bacteroidia bacterium]
MFTFVAVGVLRKNTEVAGQARNDGWVGAGLSKAVGYATLTYGYGDIINPNLVHIYDPVKVEHKIKYHEREIERAKKIIA